MANIFDRSKESSLVKLTKEDPVDFHSMLYEIISANPAFSTLKGSIQTSI